MKRTVDAAIFVDAVVVLAPGIFPTRSSSSWNFVRCVAVDLVCTEEDKNGIGTMLARGLEKIDRA